MKNRLSQSEFVRRAAALCAIVLCLSLFSRSGQTAPVDAPVQNDNWTLTYKEKGAASRRASVTLTAIKEKGLPVLALDWPLPFNDVTQVKYVGDNGAASSVLISRKGNSVRAKLTSGRGTLRITRASGTVEFVYKLETGSGLLKMDPKCTRVGVKSFSVSRASSSYPALIVCRGNSETNVPKEIVFSTLKDAEWFGSTAFETSGKGERYKTFNYSDASAIQNWRLTWGADNSKVSYRLKFATIASSAPVPPQPAFSFEGSVGLLSGSFKDKDLKETMIGPRFTGVVGYQKQNANWYSELNTDLFLFSLKKTGASSPITIGGDASVGLTQNPGLIFKEALGYSVRSLTLPGLETSSLFAAPKLTLSATQVFSQSMFETKFGYATASTGGAYSEMQVGASYILLKADKQRAYRIGVSYQKISAKSATIVNDGGWLAIDLGYSF